MFVEENLFVLELMPDSYQWIRIRIELTAKARSAFLERNSAQLCVNRGDSLLCVFGQRAVF